jgi:hypothetical protein
MLIKKIIDLIYKSTTKKALIQVKINFFDR